MNWLEDEIIHTNAGQSGQKVSGNLTLHYVPTNCTSWSEGNSSYSSLMRADSCLGDDSLFYWDSWTRTTLTWTTYATYPTCDDYLYYINDSGLPAQPRLPVSLGNADAVGSDTDAICNFSSGGLNGTNCYVTLADPFTTNALIDLCRNRLLAMEDWQALAWQSGYYSGYIGILSAA